MTIFWMCPKPDAPSGGVWFIHRLARLCQCLGYQTQLVKEKFPVWWDAHPAENVETFEQVMVEDGDTVIVPECWWHQVEQLNMVRGAGGTVIRMVMLLQNHIWLNKEYFRAHPGPVIVCSQYLANWLEREYGQKPIGIVNPYLDDDVWSVTPKVRRRVLFYSRRTDQRLVDYLFDNLQAKGYHPYVVADPKTQWQLAAHFDEAEYYLHLAEPEGFPMACLEAMRSGTLVIGTTGGGGNEFMFDGRTALTVAGPVMGHYEGGYQWQEFGEKLIERLQAIDQDDAARSRMWQLARNWSLRYTEVETEAQLGEALR